MPSHYLILEHGFLLLDISLDIPVHLMVDLEVFMLIVDGVDLLVYAGVDRSVLLLQCGHLTG